MLSIGKLGPAHYAYYEQSVADGREDCYAGAGEEQGRYIGSDGATLGFTGDVAEGDLKHLFRGTHPDRPGAWLERQQQNKAGRRITLPSGDVVELAAPVQTAAFDLTFSAPKSVSVLWALGDKPVAHDVKQAHEHAVREAVDYLERTACMVRRGKGGHRHIRADGFIAAAFNHRSSRAGDPQLHTHVLVANAAQAEGRYTALHGAAIYREAKTAGFLYQAVLRDELTRRLGVRWDGIVNGQAEIADVDRDLLHQFSKRSDEIANQLALAGQAGPRAANAAAIDTRVAKDYAVDGFSLKQRWHLEADSRELRSPLEAVAKRSAEGRIADQTHVVAYDVADEALAPTGLTRQRSTFSRRDLIQAVCQHATDGASVEQIEQIVDAIIDRETERLVVLDGGDGPRPIGHARRANGAAITDGRVDCAITTRELLEHELTILDAMRDRAGEGAATVPASRISAWRTIRAPVCSRSLRSVAIRALRQRPSRQVSWVQRTRFAAISDVSVHAWLMS